MRAEDPRWIVLVEDGRYVILGRDREPTSDDLAGVERTMLTQKLAGWLAIMSQSEHADGTPEILEVRPLAAPSGSFDLARSRMLQQIAEGRGQSGA